MGRKLDLGDLGDAECEHILEVINRDSRLRQLEQARLQQQEKELKEEALKTALLEKQRAFNKQSTCIRCLETFPVLSFWKLSICPECSYKVCRQCSEFDATTRKFTCHVCVKTRDLRVQTLSWFYDNVKARFRRYGSAKVVRSLYKRKSGATSDSEYDSGYDPSQASSLRRPNGDARGTPTVESLFVSEGPAEEFDFPINANIQDHLDLFHDSLRAHIEELREALADFLNDDDFESDRFKRMLYTFSLKFAGDVKVFDSGLKKDIRAVEKNLIEPTARRAVFKQVENLMGIDVENSEALLRQRNGDEADQHLGELIVYKVMRDFKQEAADYCEVLDGEVGQNPGDDLEDDDDDDFIDRRRKESEEFHQLEAQFRGALRRPPALPSFGSVDFATEAREGDFNENFMFATKSRSDHDSIQAAEAAAKDLDNILEGLPERSIDEDNGGSAEGSASRHVLSQHVKYLGGAGSSDENELEDIIEEEESEEEDEGKQDTVKEKIFRRSVEGSERDTASEGGDEVDLADDSTLLAPPSTADISDASHNCETSLSSGDVFYGNESASSPMKSRAFDNSSSMYVPEPDQRVLARIGSRDANTYADSIASNLSRSSSLDEADFMMKNSVANSDQLKALSSEIIERFSKLDSMQSEDEESKNGSPRESLDEQGSNADSVRDRKKSSIATRVSNPSSEDPKFVLIPEDAEVARGEAASFVCVIEATPHLDVFWFTDEGGEAGKELEESVKYSIRQDSEPLIAQNGEENGKVRSTHKLKIFDVSEVDAGRYYCVCINSLGRNASIFHVDSCANENKKRFQSPSFVREMMDARATVGENVELNCRVAGYPKPRVVFQRNEGALVENGGKIKVEGDEENGVYSLKITDVSSDLEGRYVAFAVNAAGAVESAANILVVSKPLRSNSGGKPNPIKSVKPSVSPLQAPSFIPEAFAKTNEQDLEDLETEEIVDRTEFQRAPVPQSVPVMSYGPVLHSSSRLSNAESKGSPSAPRKQSPGPEKKSPVAPPRSNKSVAKPESTPYEPPATIHPVKKPSESSTPTKSGVDPLAALRPSSAGSSTGVFRAEAAPGAARRPIGSDGFYVIPDDDDGADLAGTQDLRRSITRKNSSRTRYRRDYYINLKPGTDAQSEFEDDASSITSSSTNLSSPRKEREDDLNDLYIIPSSGHEKNTSYVDDVDVDSRARGDGSSSFGSTCSHHDIESGSKQQREEQQHQKGGPTATKKSMPSVRELSAVFDRRGSLPSVGDAKPVVEEFLRMGSITGRSLSRKGRVLLQDVVAPSPVSNPVQQSAGSRAGSTSSLASLRSSLRSSIRSFAGMKVSNVDDERTTPDGASLGGGEEGEEEDEENNPIFV